MGPRRMTSRDKKPKFPQSDRLLVWWNLFMSCQDWYQSASFVSTDISPNSDWCQSEISNSAAMRNRLSAWSCHLPGYLEPMMYTSMIIERVQTNEATFLQASRNTYCIYECIHHHQHEILPKKINYRRVLGILFSRLQSCTLSEFFPNE